MADSLASGLTDVHDAPPGALRQAERAIAETLEHHAHVRLMPASSRAG
jgi:DNA repair protein RecO (recombination protein O)